MSGEPHFLELRGLGKRFGATPVLDGVSLALARGQLLALLGPSGSGKTTVLRLLAGFESCDRGEIWVGGQEVSKLPPARRGFGMVFQHYALFPHMTVAENVAFGLEARGVGAAARAERVAAMLELVDLPGLGARKVSEISGGQQQRVALARALAPEPRLLLLDEPLSNLDPTLRERTRRELRAAVRRVGITTVLVTHEQEEAFDVGDQVAVLHRGRVEQVGRPEELYAEPRSRFVATFVGRSARLAGVCGGIAGGLASVRLAAPAGQEPAVWTARLGEALEPGEAAELVVRPEALRLVAAGNPGSIGGRVIGRRFTGASTFAVVELEDGVEAEVLVDGPSPETETAVGVAPRDGAPTPNAFRRAEPGA